MDCSLPGSSVHGILQARVLEWAAISFSRGSSWPREQTQVSSFADRFFTIWATCALRSIGWVGHEFEQAPGVGDGQGSLVCCSPWGHKESDTTKPLNWTELNWGWVWTLFMLHFLYTHYKKVLGNGYEDEICARNLLRAHQWLFPMLLPRKSLIWI